MLKEILHAKLLLVTGKGGVGKTSFSSALGKVLSKRGKRVLIVEIDNFNSALEGIFQKRTDYLPTLVEERLYTCNITWNEALSDWLTQTVKMKRVVNMIKNNRIAMIYLDATPGAREIVILSKIIEYLNAFDHVIVDLPASGHALGILKVPKTAINLMRAGPVHDKAIQILDVLSTKTTLPVIISLPEEMVVNETIELVNKLKTEVPFLPAAKVILNRASVPSFSDPEKELLASFERHLEETSEDLSTSKAFVQAGRWEEELEVATANALQEFKEKLLEEIFFFSRLGYLGGFFRKAKASLNRGLEEHLFGDNHRTVVEQMTSALNRQFEKEIQLSKK